jgi:class 3 adenylate cyclase
MDLAAPPDGAQGRAADGWWSLDATLVLADLAGFTALTERLDALGRAGAEVLTDVVCGVLDRVLAPVAPAGGHVLTFGGDAALVLLDGEDHRARGRRLAEAMAQALRDLPPARTGRAPVRLTGSVGLASGRVDLHAVAGELVPAGPAVTAVQHAQAAAPPGTVAEADPVAGGT